MKGIEIEMFGVMKLSFLENDVTKWKCKKN